VSTFYYKVVMKDLMCCTSAGDSVLCQSCVSENTVSEESTLSKNTVCVLLSYLTRQNWLNCSTVVYGSGISCACQTVGKSEQ